MVGRWAGGFWLWMFVLSTIDMVSFLLSLISVPDRVLFLSRLIFFSFFLFSFFLFAVGWILIDEEEFWEAREGEREGEGRSCRMRWDE